MNFRKPAARTRFWILAMASLIAWPNVAVASTAETPATRVEAMEAQDRRVDLVAIDAQQKGIAKLKSLLRRFRGSPQEAPLLVRLGEMLQQSSALEFRIANGRAQKRGGVPNLARYHALLREVSDTYGLFIKKFPSDDSADQAYFGRANANEELGRRDQAKKDYLFLVGHFPDSPWMVRSYMSLADFSIAANHQQEALGYLAHVERLPDDPHYPFALYKMAWAHYNLKQIPESLAYLKRHVRYFDKQRSQADSALSEADEAMREHSLLDAATFYLQGIDDGTPGFSVAHALDTFRDLDSGPGYGKMYSRFAKLLRSQDRDADLLQLKNSVLDSEPNRPETLEVLVTEYEYCFNNRKLTQLSALARDFASLDAKTDHRIRSFPTYPAAKHLLSDIAQRLQKLTLKNKNATDVGKLTQALASTYSAFTGIVDESDPSIPRVHYNLAETQFDIKDYAGATANYRWVLDHWSKRAGLEKKTVFLKSLTARYEDLRRKKLIPTDLVPAKPDGDEELKLKSLDPLLAQWVTWVDQFADDYGREDATFANLAFEADRAIYAQGQTRAAVKRLVRTIRSAPHSRFAIPSASLVLDTYLAGQLWVNLYQAADQFASLLGKDGKSRGPEEAFEKKLLTLGGDAYYKTIELAYQDKKYEDAQSLTSSFLEKYPLSARASDAVFLSARAAQELKEPRKAIEGFTSLLEHYPKSPNRADALLLRATLRENLYQTELAAADYQAYLDTHPAKPALKPEELRKRMLLLLSLSEKPINLDCAPFGDDLAASCQRIQALLEVEGLYHSKADLSSLLQRALHGPRDERALWSAIALSRNEKPTFYQRLALIRSMATQWDRLDSLGKFALVPLFPRLLPSALQAARTSLDKVSPLRPNSKSLAARIELIGALESAASKIVKLPWASVKTAALREVGQTYLDFSRELAALPLPKNLSDQDKADYLKTVAEIVNPFEEKGKKIRAQAYDVAANSCVEKAFLDSVADAASPNERAPAATAEPISVSLLDGLDHTSNWKRLGQRDPLDLDTQGDRIKAMWVSSLDHRDWARVAFFVQELKDKAEPERGTLDLMRAVALARAGAQAEAVSELESARDEVNPSVRGSINDVLLSQYRGSGASEKLQRLKKEMEAGK